MRRGEGDQKKQKNSEFAKCKEGENILTKMHSDYQCLFVQLGPSAGLQEAG